MVSPHDGEETQAVGQPPTISVVIPTVGGPLLADVLAQLDAQSDLEPGSMDVVVVVDGQAPSAALPARSRVNFPLRVLGLRHSGVAAARDMGWRAAQGSVVLFVDDDVVPSVRLVAEHLRAQKEHGPCVVLGSVQPPAGRRLPWIAYDDRVMAKKYRRLSSEELPSGIHYGGNVSLPRRMLEAVGGHDHALHHDADIDLGFRLRQQGVMFVYCSAAAGVHHGSAEYRAWRRRHFLHGRWEVALGRDRPGGLEDLLACYYDRHPLNRLAIRLGLGRRSAESGGMADSAAWVGALAYRLRLGSLAYAAFSCSANVLYWSGVRDGMRGSAAFWAGIRSARHHRGRPYLLVRPRP